VSFEVGTGVALTSAPRSNKTRPTSTYPPDAIQIGISIYFRRNMKESYQIP
jgi:hypothetical protein